jgi:hypothetical protein
LFPIYQVWIIIILLLISNKTICSFDFPIMLVIVFNIFFEKSHNPNPKSNFENISFLYRIFRVPSHRPNNTRTWLASPNHVTIRTGTRETVCVKLFFNSFPSYYTTKIIIDLTYIRADTKDKTINLKSLLSMMWYDSISSSLPARF